MRQDGQTLHIYRRAETQPTLHPGSSHTHPFSSPYCTVAGHQNLNCARGRFFQHQPTKRKSANLQATPDLSESSKDSGMPLVTKHESEIEEEQNAHQHTHASTTSTPIYPPKQSNSGEGLAETFVTCLQPRPRNTKHGIRALGTTMVMLARRQQQKSRVAKAIALKEKRQAEANAAANARWPDRSKYNERSLFLFDLSHPLRRFVIAGIVYTFFILPSLMHFPCLSLIIESAWCAIDCVCVCVCCASVCVCVCVCVCVFRCKVLLEGQVAPERGSSTPLLSLLFPS